MRGRLHLPPISPLTAALVVLALVALPLGYVLRGGTSASPAREAQAVAVTTVPAGPAIALPPAVSIPPLPAPPPRPTPEAPAVDPPSVEEPAAPLPTPETPVAAPPPAAPSPPPAPAPAPPVVVVPAD